MRRSLLFTFIANDKPGIVDLLSKTVSSQGGNWLESRLTKLSGKFAGVVSISIAEDKVETLSQGLKKLESEGITILLDENSVSPEQSGLATYSISIIGLDRPGIVREIAQAMAERQLNVIEFHSLIESAPMTGEPLFKAEIIVQSGNEKDVDSFEEELESICQKLDLDWSLNSQ